uniref:CBF1-interacting co-repressor CIR N-terminal domain-containing protein n=1 Tax=Aegilops tauschii subsp. strangulata TaxID=200361 RepID=A0A452YJ46_AEGTS
MGGHGGLNILPQKRWNVYRFDNQEKVRVDEAEAARQDQLQREATRRRESHARLVALRRNRGLHADQVAPPRPPPPAARSADQVAPPRPPPPAARPAIPPPVASDGDHINLFSGGGGAADFAALASASGGRGAAREREPAADTKPNPKKRKKEEEVRTAGPDDEKYKLGYGLAGKGVAAPWYMSKPFASSSKERRDYPEGNGEKRSGGKKSIEELREERRKREAKEKERERALLATTARKERQPDRGYSSRYVRR